MTEKTSPEEQAQEQPQETKDPFDLKDIFAKRHLQKTAEITEASSPEIEEKKKSESVSQDPKGSDSKKNVKEGPKDSEKQEDSPQRKELDYKSEYEKIDKSYKETKKWGTEAHKKLSAYEKSVKKLAQNGDIDEEAMNALLSHTAHEDEGEKELTPFQVYAPLWDQEVDNMRKYLPHTEEIDQSVEAFQYFLRNGDSEDIEEAFEEFAKVKDDPVKLTKKMIEIGKSHYEDYYGDFKKSGGLRGFNKSYQAKISDYEKKIDKLQKEINMMKEKYEGYTSEALGRLTGSSGFTHSPKENSNFDLKKIFSKRFKR